MSIISTRTIVRSFHVRLIFAAMSAFLLIANAAYAEPNAEAEQYVQKLADEVSAVLSNSTLSTEDKAEQLRRMIDQYLDVQRIAYFALGKYRRDANEQGVIGAYVEAFKSYSISLYESRLTEYGGERLKVTGSEDRNGKGTDLVVKSIIEGNGEPFSINWRVIRTESGMTIVDAQVEGIWLALDLREQFASIIANNGGKVQALIDHLKGSTIE